MTGIHIIKGSNGNNVLFHGPSFTILHINDEVYSILDSLLRIGIKRTADKMGYKESDLRKFQKSIETQLDCNIESSLGKSRGDKEILRITLHISNDCNLRCSYCYANGGNYTLKRDKMSIYKAQEFIRFCIANFTCIENIVFFGGEPFLNMEIIDYVCEQFKKNFSSGVINYLPKFGAITNGTIINETILNTIRKHFSFLTISVDGPEYINDKCRIYPNGKGSYKRIAEFIRKVKSSTDVSLRYEATYNKQHVDFCFSQRALSLFMRDEFGIDGDIVTELSMDDASVNSTFLYENIDFSDMPSGFWEVLYSIVNRIPKKMCHASKDIFSVSTQGFIYPCHMNTGMDNTCLGNIEGENIFNTPKKYKDKFPLHFIIVDKEKICGSCWAKHICGGCTKRWFFDNENAQYNTMPNVNLCKISKKEIENIILLIDSIRKDPKLWSDFKIYCKKNYDYETTGD